MRTQNRNTIGRIILLLIFILSAFPCLWADGSESYHEPTSFDIRWIRTNDEIARWTIEEYDPDNPIIDIVDENRIVILTPDDGEDFQPVCKVIYSSNKRGVQNFYCKATPFKAVGSDESAGYTLRFVLSGSSSTYDYEVDAAFESAYYHLPIELDTLSTETGLASEVIFVSVKLSDFESMATGTNKATLSFVKEAL